MHLESVRFCNKGGVEGVDGDEVDGYVFHCGGELEGAGAGFGFDAKVYGFVVDCFEFLLVEGAVGCGEGCVAGVVEGTHAYESDKCDCDE